jgi:hypothetical protein
MYICKFVNTILTYIVKSKKLMSEATHRSFFLEKNIMKYLLFNNNYIFIINTILGNIYI